MKKVSLKGANPDTTAECLLEVTGDDIFVVYSGRRIAMRGDARDRISLLPGYRVVGDPGNYENIRVIVDPEAAPWH